MKKYFKTILFIGAGFIAGFLVGGLFGYDSFESGSHYQNLKSYAQTSGKVIEKDNEVLKLVQEAFTLISKAYDAVLEDNDQALLELIPQVESNMEQSNEKMHERRELLQQLHDSRASKP